MDSDGDGFVSEDEYTAYAASQSRRLDLILTSQELTTNLKLSMVKSIAGNDEDSGTTVSAAATAATILGKYTKNMSENMEELIANLDVEA